jgi:DNA-binding MarR family transcriptional regulator
VSHDVIPETTTDAAGALPELVELAGLVHGAFARIAGRQELTPVQGRMLCVLEEGPRRMAELGQCLGTEKAALTGLVDRAERRGLVSRTPVPGDRRSVLVTLTDAGARSADAFHADVRDEFDRILEPLSEADRDDFRRMMATIIASCRTSPREDADV